VIREYIRNCAWGISCDAKWEKLSPTQVINVKFCDSCQREVHRCKDENQIALNLELNRSISFSEEAVKKMNMDDGTPANRESFCKNHPQKQQPKVRPAQDFIPDLDEGWDDDIPF